MAAAIFVIVLAVAVADPAVTPRATVMALPERVTVSGVVPAGSVTAIVHAFA
jgi:hypothetical protein